MNGSVVLALQCLQQLRSAELSLIFVCNSVDFDCSSAEQQYGISCVIGPPLDLEYLSEEQEQPISGDIGLPVNFEYLFRSTSRFWVSVLVHH